MKAAGVAVDPPAPRLADVLKARLCLMLGGIVGAHRLYLDHIPEAFIFLSTGGVFLIGVFYDSFFINGYVHEYNATAEKQMVDDQQGDGTKRFKGGRLAAAEHVRFSLSRFVFSSLYAMWLGWLVWLADSLTFSHPLHHSLPLTVAIAGAIAAGVYIAGNCAGEQRNILYIWVTAFSSTLLLNRLVGADFARTLLLSSLLTVSMGNRSARKRERRQGHGLNKKHFVFWTSLFALVVCVMCVGASRHVLEKRITSVSQDGHRQSATIATLIHERLTQPVLVRRFFEKRARIEWSLGETSKTKEQKGKESRRKKKDGKEWWRAYVPGVGVLDWLDEHSTAPHWAAHAAVFTVDVMRAEMHVLEGRSKAEPLQWALWRLYITMTQELPATVTDEAVELACAKWKKKRESGKRASFYKGQKEGEQKEEEDYLSKSTQRACEVMLL